MLMKHGYFAKTYYTTAKKWGVTNTDNLIDRYNCCIAHLRNNTTS